MKKLILSIAILAACLIGACSKEHVDSDPNDGNGGNNGNNPSSEIELKLSEMHLFVSSDAITKTVALTANADWNIDQNFAESEWAWCSITPTYGSAGTTTLTVDIQANGYDKRIHDFSIRSGDTDISLTVEQKQYVSFFIGGSREFVFYDEGGQIELMGGSSVGCEILYLDEAADWISEEKKTRAFEPLNFRFRIAPYDGRESRHGRIVLKAPGEDLADTVQIIQYHDKVIEIPDPYFRKYCLTNFDTNNDGEITKRETEGVTSIRAANLNIRTVRGIEEFADLTWFDCSENQISELNVSKNEKLASLYCDNNQISTLLFNRRRWEVFYCSNNQIVSLGDIPIGASFFSCSDNPIESLTLDTSFVTAHGTIHIMCDNTLLTELDLSKCANVYWLSCSGNKLQRLDLSNCRNLNSLGCYNNLLEEIRLPENGKISSIRAYKNRLKKIDLRQSIFLTSLWISENDLVTLDCSGCVSLERLDCDKNKLQSLNLTNCPVLKSIDCADNLLTTLDVSETGLNKSDNIYPLDCAPMPALEIVYLKEGWIRINGINYNRSKNYIPESTQIFYK